MDVINSSGGTEFFEIPEQFMSDSSAAASMQTSDVIIRNESGEFQNPISNVYFEIETRPLYGHGIDKQSMVVNQIEINTDNLDSIICDNTNTKTNPENFSSPQNDSNIQDNTDAQWFEEDVDLTKIFLCNTEGALDEFNLGFSENILFGSVDDPQSTTKLDKTSDNVNIVENNTTFELNNNINCESYATTSTRQPDTNGDPSKINSNEIVSNIPSLSVQDAKSESKRDSTSAKTPFNCPHCSKSFRYSSRLKRHLTTHQNKQFPCRICHKLFSRIDVMETHIARTHFKTHRPNIKNVSNRQKHDRWNF